MGWISNIRQYASRRPASIESAIINAAINETHHISTLPYESTSFHQYSAMKFVSHFVPARTVTMCCSKRFRVSATDMNDHARMSTKVLYMRYNAFLDSSMVEKRNNSRRQFLYYHSACSSALGKKKEGRLHQVSTQTRKEEQRKQERQNRYILVLVQLWQRLLVAMYVYVSEWMGYYYTAIDNRYRSGVT